jgi:hypothetical protein
MRYAIDPVIEEIRDTRRKLYARCGNDPHKYGKFLQTSAQLRKVRLARKHKATTHA